MILEYLSTDWRVQFMLIVAVMVAALMKMATSQSTKLSEISQADKEPQRKHERDMWVIKNGPVAIEHKRSDE